MERDEDSTAAVIAAHCVCRMAMDLEPVLPWPVGREAQGQGAACLAIVAEGPSAILVCTEEDGVLIVELESLCVRKVCELGKITKSFLSLRQLLHRLTKSVQASYVSF